MEFPPKIMRNRENLEKNEMVVGEDTESSSFLPLPMEVVLSPSLEAWPEP